MLVENIMEKQRLKKHKQFMEFCRPTGKDTLLDVGAQNAEYKASDNYIEKNYPFPSRITALGTDKLPDFRKRHPKVKAITYNGRKFPFKDRSFDFVWSNAVIEHVGDLARQELFLSEVLRVAKRKIMLTTPNRGFPIEIHTRLPFVHWLPREKANCIYAKLGKKWAAGDYMFLLDEKAIRKMLDKAGRKYPLDYKLIKNRFFGVTGTFTILIEKK